MQRIRVLLADDHTVVREGLRSLLAAETDMEVVGEAVNGREAVQMARAVAPDVAVMDIAMPSLNGLEATRQICRFAPSTKVLILSSYSGEDYARLLFEAGASGYLAKQTAANELLKGIREVHRGRVFFSPGIVAGALAEGRSRPPGRRMGAHLTLREAEVLQLIAEGRANKQIAGDLSISIKTVEKHRQQVMNKLGIHDVAGLTRHAISHGIIEADRGLGVP